MFISEKINKIYEETCNKANVCIKEEIYEAATLTVRRGIEGILKNYCDDMGVDTYDETGKELPLELLINRLLENGYIDDGQCSTLHRIRELGNRGAHFNDSDVTSFQAEDALELFKEFYTSFSGSYETHKAESNEYSLSFMHNPDYYSPKRKYFGMWANCYTRHELMSIPDYVRLEKAANAGDCNAMLDLAIGFVSKHSVWTSSHLICMPPYRFNGNEYLNPDAYDARYYYWVRRATERFTSDDVNSESSRKAARYIATAMLDAIKSSIVTIGSVNYFVTSVSRDKASGSYVPLYTNQYELVKEMFNVPEMSHINLIDSLYNLFRIIYLDSITDWSLFVGDAYDTHLRIIAPIHENTTIRSLNYLLYCASYILNESDIQNNRNSNLIRTDALYKSIMSDPDLPIQYSTEFACYRASDYEYGVIDRTLIAKYANDNADNKFFFDFVTSIDYNPERTVRAKEQQLKAEFEARKMKKTILGFLTLGLYFLYSSKKSCDRLARFLGVSYNMPSSLLFAQINLSRYTVYLAQVFCQLCAQNNITTSINPSRYRWNAEFGIDYLEYEILKIFPEYKNYMS